MTARLFPVVAALGVLVSGCAETELALHAVKRMEAGAASGASPEYKIGKPYRIDGVWYYPAEDFTYSETGIASWYGPQFHGRRTANGELYDMNRMTAAHRTLPLPSVVRVTNLRNGRTIKVRVNDRGPFARGRIIDLSRRSAQLLGFIDQGTAPVRVEIVADESRQLAALAGKPVPAPGRALPAPRVTVASLPVEPAPQPRQPAPARARSGGLIAPAAAATLRETPPAAVPLRGEPRLFVQAGAFIERTRADSLRQRLMPVGAARVVEATVGARRFYRVRIGPLASVAEGDRVLDRVVDAGFPEARLVVD